MAGSCSVKENVSRIYTAMVQGKGGLAGPMGGTGQVCEWQAREKTWLVSF